MEETAGAGNGLRLAGFGLTALGALLAGLGAIQTWVTVGLRNVQTNTDTVVPGTDLPDGMAVLAASIVMLGAVLAVRVLSGRRGRAAAASVVIACSFVCIAVGGAFFVMAENRSDILDLIAEAELRPSIEYFVEIGPGPLLAVAGGVLAFVGGVLSLAWATRPEIPVPSSER